MSLIVNVSCKGSTQSRRFVLDEKDVLEVGRGNDDLNLVVDPRLSRKHFEIRYVDQKIEIKHLSKTNPTMVARHGTSDFKKVQEVRVEEDACRIIAGSHRFVLTVEKPDSAVDKTMDVDHSDFWSDVDNDESKSGPVQAAATIVDAESGKRATGSPVRKSVPTLKTLPEEVDSPISNGPSETVKDGGFPKPSSQRAADVFSDDVDDDFDEMDDVEEAAPPEKEKGQPTVREVNNPTLKEPAPKPKKNFKPTPKPFFPISDDFFDD